MTREESQGEPADQPLEGHATIQTSTGSPELLSTSVITESETQGSQTWSIERSKLELKAQADERKHEIEKDRVNHQLAETTKDNNLRRICIGGIVVMILLVLAVSTVMVIVEPADSKNQWAQSVVTTVLGSLLGAIAGYFAGRRGI